MFIKNVDARKTYLYFNLLIAGKDSFLRFRIRIRLYYRQVICIG